MAKSASPQTPERVDPKSQGPKPEHPQPPIVPPGSDREMRPRADHGEESYRGLGRLTDKVALITRGDSGIGRAIVNTASIQAFAPSPTLLPYAATKAALVNLTKTLSHIGMKRGVR